MKPMRLTDQEIDVVARSFALLSHPTRLRILSYLLEAGEASPTEVAEGIRRGRASVSHHLSRLLVGGMVGRRGDGQVSRYCVIDDALRPLCELVCSGVRNRTNGIAGALETVAR